MVEYLNDYIKFELMVCCGVREIYDGDVVVVGMGFFVMLVNIVKYIYVFGVVMMQELGVYDVRLGCLVLFVGDVCLNFGLVMIGGLIDVMGMFLQGGWVDVGFLFGVQVDCYGNLNMICIGFYDFLCSRLLGSGGVNFIGVLVRRMLIIVQYDFW